MQYFNKLVRPVKIQTTGKCTQQYYTATRPISYLSYSCFILSAFLSRREKRNRWRSVGQAANRSNRFFFFTEKNNQLSKYRVIFSWYSIRGLFVLYLVQLDNKFGEHEKSVRVTSETAKSNYYFSSAPRTSHGQMH